MPTRLLLLLPLLLVHTAHAFESAAAARAITQQHEDAVITVRTVLEVTVTFGEGQSQTHEFEEESSGTVFSPDGVTVMPLSDIDIESRLEASATAGDPNVDSRLSKVALLLNDGTELDAEVILRDRDLDLAFLRPIAPPESPLAHIDINAAAQVQQFDTVVFLYRLGRAQNRECGGYVSIVNAVMEKPRRLYLVEEFTGTVAFDLKGKLVGITAYRFLSSSQGLANSDWDENAAVVIVPAESIADGLEQVPPRKEGDTPESTDEG